MQVDLLINLVRDLRERSAIYDISDPLHHDRDAIVTLWKNIASEMKCRFELNNLYLVVNPILQ